MKEAIQAAAEVIVDAALRLIQADPHQWSERPCSTCRAVSEIVNKPFGCVLYTIARKDMRMLTGNQCRKCGTPIPSGCVLCDTCPSDGRADAIHDGG